MKKLLLIGVTAFIMALLLCLQTRFHHKKLITASSNPQKIVSLAPAITETLYFLGLDDQVAGVTEFCKWPDTARLKSKVGGYREVNLESIARTGADLVVMPENMAHFRKLVEDMGIPVLLFDSQNLDNFLRDVATLADITGTRDKAAELLASFDEVVNEDRSSPVSPAVLFALMNPDEYARPVTELTIIGKDGFYDKLIQAAGGRNAYTGATPFPRIGVESIISINPDLIVVAVPEASNVDLITSSWHKLSNLKAIHNGNFLIFDDPGDTIPGPRSLLTLRKIAYAIARLERKEGKS